MLRLQKNSIVTGAAKSQVEIRQMEIDWYCSSYSTMTAQAALLAGFAFAQLRTPMPEDHPPPFMLQLWYMFLTCAAIGLELSVIVLSAFLSVWAPSLALRGKKGSADIHKAVDVLRNYQQVVFSCFMIGWVVFFISSINQVWIYFRRHVAMVVTFPMSFFIFAILWYCYDITKKLRLSDDEAVIGKIDNFEPYENIADIDHGLHNGLRATTSTWLDSHDTENKENQDYCPVHETVNGTFQPKRAPKTATMQSTNWNNGLFSQSHTKPLRPPVRPTVPQTRRWRWL